MKSKHILFILFISLPLLAVAQRQGRKFEEYLEKFKSERVSFITQKLDLSVEEATKFWPVYNEYQTKREALMEQGRGGRFRHSIDSLDEKQMEEMMDKKIESDLKMAELAAQYHKAFKKILPVKKVFNLYRAEQEFMNHMVNRLRDDSGDWGRGSGGGKPDREK